MIERQTLSGRDATIAYLDDKFQLIDREHAAIIKVSFDDGEMLFLTAKPDADNDDAAEED